MAPVVVLGGGPAGCAAATTLARLGHPVRLLTRPSAVGAPRLAVSLPPSTGKLLDLLGLRGAVDAAGFVRTTGTTVWWGGQGRRVELFAAGACGWQAEVAVLERVCLEVAEAAGVEVERGRIGAEEAAALAAPFVIDATGRTGLLARRVAGRTYEDRLRSVALVGVWRRAGGWPVPDDTHTLIESYGGGWVWSVPVAADTRFVAAMVDPRLSGLARGRPARAVYEAEMARALHAREWLAGAECADGPWGWDASMYGSARYAIGRVLVAGDAGSFVDPLSAAGVRKALASGWLAGIAVHTSLVRPAMRDVALAYFEARERRMYAALAALTRRHLAAAAAGHHEPFWDERHGGPDAAALADLADAEPAAAWAAPIRAAHERLRQAAEIRLRPGVFAVESKPAVSGSEIVLEPRIAASDVPDGVRLVRGVDVLRLVDLAPAHRQVPDLYEAYCRHAGPAALPDFLLTLATALARGWLVDDGPGAPEPA